MKVDLATVTQRIDSLEVSVVENRRMLETIKSDGAGRDRSRHDLCTGQKTYDSRLDEVADIPSMLSEFFRHDKPWELRKRLYEAYRISREDTIAIEHVLQAELLVKRDLYATNDDRPDAT
jgi:hypothetical protein